MSVFPENMDKLNHNDVRSSFATIENYIRYMTERTEFAMRNTTRSVSEAGVSSVEVYNLLAAIQNDLSALESTVNVLNGSVTSVSNQVSSLQSAVSALEERVAALEQTETT